MTPRTTIGNGLYAELAGTPQSVREARALIHDALGDNHPLAHDATLAASELVSNAIIHSQSGRAGGTLIIAIEQTARPGDVRIQVRDAGGQNAPVQITNPDGEHGRGLAIIAAIAADWGSQTNRIGCTTWCRLARDPGPAITAARVPEREAG